MRGDVYIERVCVCVAGEEVESERWIHLGTAGAAQVQCSVRAVCGGGSVNLSSVSGCRRARENRPCKTLRNRPPAAGDVVIFRPAEGAADGHEGGASGALVGARGDDVFIKRVVAVGGDTVEVRRPGATPGVRARAWRFVGSCCGHAIPQRITLAIRTTPPFCMYGNNTTQTTTPPPSLKKVRDGALFVNGTRQEEPFLPERPSYRLGRLVVPPGDVFVLGDNRNHSYDSHVWGPLPGARVLGRAAWVYWPPRRAGALPDYGPDYARSGGGKKEKAAAAAVASAAR